MATQQNQPFKTLSTQPGQKSAVLTFHYLLLNFSAHAIRMQKVFSH